MSGKKIIPVLYTAAVLIVILNCAGIMYLNKVYNMSFFHLIIFFVIQIVLALLIIVFFNSNRKFTSDEKKLLELCSNDFISKNRKYSVYKIISILITDYQKKISEAAASEDEYSSLNLKIKNELKIITDEISSRKQSAEELRIFKSRINDLLLSVKAVEKHYRNYNSSINSFAENQTEAAENLNGIIGNLIQSIDNEAVIASRAEDISSKMTDTVKSGGDDISKTIALISAVEQLSGQISEINAVIDNITELTNLLAMNAAIEAAHAGDAGKGFAVVAGEIQKLSKETSKSSGKISELVKNVSEAVRDMTSNAENASEGLTAIMESVNRTGCIVKDITGAIMQQSEDGSRVLAASNTILESAGKITDDLENINRFPEILEKIEGCSTIIDSGVESIIDDLDRSEGRIRDLISSIK